MTLTNKTASKAGRSKFAKARKQLTPTELFFFEHAGYSYDPKTETPEQGRIRCAKDLASAEQYAFQHDWWYEWSDDWDIGSHTDYYGKGSVYENHEPTTCESCLLRDSAGTVLESMGCIDDADSNYRRVVQAEMASDAMRHAKKTETDLAESIQHMN